MIEVLVIEQNQRVIDLIGAILYREFNAVVTDMDSAKDAVNTIEDATSYDLIIVRDCLPGEQSAAYLRNILQDKKIDVPTIVLGNLFSDAKVVNLESHFKSQDLINNIVSMLNLTKEQLEQIKIPEYVAIPTYYFTMINSSPCDAYIRIEKIGEDDQYVKRIHKGDNIERKAVDNYQSSGLTVFYVNKNDRHAFIDIVVKNSVEVIEEQLGSDDDDKVVATLADTFDISQDLIAGIGITPEIVDLVTSTVKGFVGSFSSGTQLGSLIRALLNSPGSYAYKHSHMIALMSSKVIPQMDWWPKNQIKINLIKMTFVAFFHDILLPRDDLVRLATKNDLVLAHLSKEDRDLVENHANQISTTVLSYPRAPAGVDVILRQHHGVGNGIGLPRSYSSSISSMAIMFIVLEGFVDRLLNFQVERLTIPEILNRLDETYTQPAYRRCIKAIRECLKAGL